MAIPRVLRGNELQGSIAERKVERDASKFEGGIMQGGDRAKGRESGKQGLAEKGETEATKHQSDDRG